MIKTAVIAAVAALVTIATSTPASAAEGRGVILVGDSLTVRAEPSLPDGWHVDGKGGRKVTLLPTQIKADLAAHVTPGILIIALGQNESPGWGRGDYRKALNMVPDSTEVLMVNTYRDPAFFGEERAAIQEQYSRWMDILATNQPNVSVIDWRGAVLDGTVILTDGSHPDVEGALYRARMMVKAVRAARS